jgi:A118 family predicted phage portal protein
MGIAVYANAIDQIKGVDIAYDSYVNEFVLGKKRVMVQPSATKNLDGESVFDPADVTFYVLPEDVKDGAIIQPIDMSLRTAEHQQGVQNHLNMLSAKCGFGEQHYKFDQGNVATATQIVSENSTLFRTIKKHELVLESLLIELCRILLNMGNIYMGQSLDEDVEISIDFDDSIIEDKATDQARVYQMLAAGLMKPDEARSILMNEDIETAREALPTMMNLTAGEDQDEVE